MQKTANYGLNKPEADDFYDVEHQNENMDIIDAKLKEMEGGGGATAADTSYDNTTSKLASDNVQGAIDEIKGSLGTQATYTLNGTSLTITLL